MGNALEYRERLPPGCPPDKAKEIVAPRIVYRLVGSNPPSLDDFRSLRSLNPGLKYPDEFIECLANGVSVYTDIEAADGVRQDVDKLSDTLICRVVLDKGAGRILLTNPETSHCAWRPFAEYAILANCQVIE